MKKCFITIGLLLLIVLLILFFLKFERKHINGKNCSNKIDLNEIYYSINSNTDSFFDLVKDEDIGLYLSMDFSKVKDYLVAARIDVDNEFYIIMKNLTKEQLNTLKDMVNAKKKTDKDKFNSTKVETYNGITYVIFSPNYVSAIGGIIRDYAYCE